MGNSQSTKFGSVHKPGKDCRPGYYVNSTGVYYGGNLITNNITNFQKLKYGYAKNNVSVFYNGKVIRDADPLTFRTCNRGHSENPTNHAIGIDAHSKYKHGSKINI